MKFNKLLIISSLIIPTLIGCVNHKVNTMDFALINNNYKKMIKETTSLGAYKDKTISEIKNELDEVAISGILTYKFKNIDYTDDKRRTEFPARKHLDRTLQIAIKAENENNEELKEIVRKLIYHWVFNNYTSANWYENEIATIKDLTDIGLFTFNSLNDKGKEAFKGKVRNASIYYHPGLEKHQGANLMNYAQNTFKNGIIERNESEADCGFNRLMEEIKEDDKEGYQSEGSYFQHGRLLSTGSYGVASTELISKFLSTIKGSKYKVSKNKLDILLNYLLVGTKYMTHKNYQNYMISGRSFCLKDPYEYSVNNYKRLLDVDGISQEKKNELTSLFAAHDNKTSTFTNEIHLFPKARVIASNIDNVYISFKGTDPITVNSECLNNENEYAYNLSFGMNTCVMQSGLEYENLSPVCNFSFMPGATSIDYGSKENGSFTKDGDEAIFAHIKDLENERFEDKVESLRDDGSKYIYGSSDDVKNNNIAVMYQQGKHSKKTTASKTFNGQTFTIACFSTNKGMVILGAGMKDLDNETATRYVTLEQATKDNNIDEITAIDENKTVERKNKIDNTTVYYKSLNDQAITLKTPTVNGDFKRNHSTYKPTETTTITKDVMMAYMPIINNSYAYSIQSKNENNFIVASNNENVQAIVLPGNTRIAAIFYNKDKEKQSFEYNREKYELSKTFVDGEGAFEIFDIK